MDLDFSIQSCLRDELHKGLVAAKNLILLEDHLTFSLGDSFGSFEELKARMEAHSKQSNVHYWMRDSRTVRGARMKTTRRIEPCLKYYSVKYACVYGGHKFYSKGQGKRNCMTMKLDCPAHVTLRVNRAGERLDVVAMCNHHNHPISPQIYSHLRQERRLDPQLKEEVLDFLRLGVVKKRIIEYVRIKNGKSLLYKDVINMTTAVKGTAKPTQQRRDFLMDALKKCEAKQREDTPHAKEANVHGIEVKKRRKPRRKLICVKEQQKNVPEPESVSVEVANEEQVEAMQVEENINFNTENDLEDEQPNSVADTEVEIRYEEESSHSLAHSNILKYLYQTDCDAPVLAILNEDQEMVTLDNDHTVQYNLISPGEALESNDHINSCEIMNFEEHSTFHDFTEPQEISIAEDIPHIVNEDAAQMLGVFEETENTTAQTTINTVISENEETEQNEIEIGDDVQYVTAAEDTGTDQLLSNNEIILEETWISDDNVTYIDSEIASGDNIMFDNTDVTSEHNALFVNSEYTSDDNITYVNSESSPEDNVLYVKTSDGNIKGETVENSDINNMKIKEPNEVDRCTNCDKIKLDLNTEVNMLRVEKRELIEETAKLRREMDSLQQKIGSLNRIEYHSGSSRVPLLMKTVKGKSKFYLVKI